ncbi:cytochrome P450 [Gonapodya prolifera JEL478]|uniref:Cytochrome P450 n=1 Tax=Gonapodya prolifera (strain JEL478) TaxID=1344416 RepID=A0A139A558_GONPJ|nr:cytochrome P450 [Gonapodya prolifera JEL478]|eukprot:KXS11920.1 cytochrome P450 [Gonapodya prolifera JEL478]
MVAISVLIALAAGVYVVWELYRRFVIDIYDDDAVTVPYIPLITYPDITKLNKRVETELGYLRKHNKTVVRFVNIFNPNDRTIIAADTELMREMFVGKDWQRWDRDHDKLTKARVFAGGLILMHNDEKWRAAREIFGRTFTTVAVKQYWPILKSNLDIFMDVIAKKNASSPDGFNIQEYFFKYTFDVISRLTFGEDINCLKGGENEKYIHAWEQLLDLSGQAIAMDIALGPSNGTWLSDAIGLKAKIDGHTQTLHEMVKRNQERRAKGIDLDRYSIFDDTMNSGKLPDFMDDAEMTKQLMTFLFAGHDTTASLLSFLAGCLATRPDYQVKIRAEVNEALAGGEQSLDKIEGLKYLNAAIKETLRLYPAAPHGAQRKVNEDWDVSWNDASGQRRLLRLKAGDFVPLGVYHGHHLASNYKNRDPARMDAWDPDVFLNDLNGGGNNTFSHVPFGGGPRKCLGEKLSLHETRLVITEILKNYWIAPAEKWTLDIHQPGMLTPANVMVRLYPL